MRCTRAGLQAGFHAIGDGAVVAVAAGMAARRPRSARRRVPAARHRVEHLELVPPEAAATLGRLGVVASVQPAFDGSGAATRPLHRPARRGRSLASNPFARLRRPAMALALGSDAPVTPLAPWEGPGRGPPPRTRVAGGRGDGVRRAHRRRLGGGRAGRGTLAAGAPAHLAVWDTGTFPDLTGELPRCIRTVASGRTIWEDGR